MSRDLVLTGTSVSERTVRIILDPILLAVALVVSLATATVGAALITMVLPPITGTVPQGICGGYTVEFEYVFHGLILPAKLLGQFGLIWLGVRWDVARGYHRYDAASRSPIERFSLRLLAVSVLWVVAGIALLTVLGFGLVLLTKLFPATSPVPELPCDDPPSELGYSSGHLFFAILLLIEFALVWLAWRWMPRRRTIPQAQGA